MTSIHIGDKEYAVEACPACGIRYAIPIELKEAAIRVRDTHKTLNRVIYCPEGHKWNYIRPTEEERSDGARAEIERLSERCVDLEEKLAASEHLVRQLGGNVTALHIKGA
jgi:hypothetical protein